MYDFTSSHIWRAIIKVMNNTVDAVYDSQYTMWTEGIITYVDREKTLRESEEWYMATIRELIAIVDSQ